MYPTAVEAQRRVLGDEHPDTLDSMSGLAGALRSTGKYEEAVAMYGATVEYNGRANCKYSRANCKYSLWSP